jgi:hypothetical protein
MDEDGRIKLEFTLNKILPFAPYENNKRTWDFSCPIYG